MVARVVKVWVTVAIVATAATMYSRHHLENFKRHDWGQSVYIEDHVNATGIKYKVMQRAYDTGNEYFTVEATLRTNATSYYDGYIGSPPEHIHLLQDETYTVVSGKMGYKIGQSAAPVATGETVTVPKGSPHTYWNMGDEELVVEITLTPAGAGEIFFETLAGLGYDHGTPDRVHPLQMLLTFHKAGMRMSEMSEWFWGLATKGLVPLAEFLGFKPFYPQYVTAGGVKPAIS